MPSMTGFASPSLQLSASSKISLRTSCGELLTAWRTRLDDGREDLFLVVEPPCGERTPAGDPKGESGVEGEFGDTGVAQPDPVPVMVTGIRWPETGDVRGDARGLRSPKPMLDVVGNGAGTSRGCSTLFCVSRRLTELALTFVLFSSCCRINSRRRSGERAAPRAVLCVLTPAAATVDAALKRPRALSALARELFDVL